MTTNTPVLVSIKLLAVSGAPSIKDVQAALSSFGSVLQYEASHLVFNGNALVPAPVATETPTAASAPTPVVAKKGGRKPGAGPVKVKAQPATPKAEPAAEQADQAGKPINFEEGSDPAKIWTLIRTSPAMTSTQIREKLGLGSNIVNTTIYRLKKAGMVRPMSYAATNGDTLYTSTEWDAKTVPMPPVKTAPEGNVLDLVAALNGTDGDEDGLDYGDEDESDEDAF